MIVKLPVTNIAPPQVSFSLAPSAVFAYTAPKVNLEFSTVTLLPTRQIVPPLEVEDNLPKAVLLVNTVSLTIQKSAPWSKLIAPPSS